MNCHAKRINPSLRPQIEKIKGYIRENTGRGFDGDGYPFKQAVREMRVELALSGKTIFTTVPNAPTSSYRLYNLP